MELQNAQTIHFSGIGGIGMSALAQLLHADGVTVQGSDLAESEMVRTLQQQGIAVQCGAQDGSAITKDVDMVIATSAIPPEHPERQRAQALGIPFMTYFEAVGEYMKQFETVIAISGTHGKSTTTAMIANVLVASGFDPTVIVGSIVKEFKSNARHGSNKYLVVEACEHREHMLNLRPHIIVLTNIEEDHLDYYRDLDHIVMTFQKYVNHLPTHGVLVKNVDDSEVADIGFDGTVIRYGLGPLAVVTAKDIVVRPGVQQFQSGDTTFTLHIPGRFNIYNALAAIALARHLGSSEAAIRSALELFHGVWRRFEVIGTWRGSTVISDYAHHPTALHSTINAAREFYPNRRVVMVFQPHQRSRTQKLFDGFVDSLMEADFVVVQEIYDVAGREEPSVNVSSRDLVAAVEKRGKYATYAEDAARTMMALQKIVEREDVVLVVGAGDVYRVAEELVKHTDDA